MNILETTISNSETKNQEYNIARGGRKTLNILFTALKNNFNVSGVPYNQEPIYLDFRSGDVRHSQADISKIQTLLGYEPQFNIIQCIEKVMPWYVQYLNQAL